MTPKLPLLAWANRAVAKAPRVTLDPQEIESFVLRKTGAARIGGGQKLINQG